MIIRAEHKTKYLKVLNAPLQDKRLSFKARGILAFLLTKPDNWTVNASYLLSESGKEGRDAIRSGLSELQRYGYLKRNRTRESGGAFGWETTLWEQPPTGPPMADAPLTDNPLADGPPTGNPPVVNPAVREPVPVKPAVTSTDRSSTDRSSTDRSSTDRSSTDRSSTDRSSTDLEAQEGVEVESFEDSDNYRSILELVEHDDPEYPNYQRFKRFFLDTNSRVPDNTKLFLREEVEHLLKRFDPSFGELDPSERFSITEGLMTSDDRMTALVAFVDDRGVDHEVPVEASPQASVIC